MDKEKLFSIGEVARLFDLSVGTLRHYETLGLVQPEYVDPGTGYRYYSVRQFEPLNTVRYLRMLGMPLPAIGDFLKNRDVGNIEQKLLRVNYLHRPGAELEPIGFNQKANDDRFSGVVQITSVRHKTDKNGREMAFVDLAASDCHIDGIIFGSTYAKIDTSNVRKGKNVRIFAKKQNDDECIIFKLDAA